MFAQLTFNLTLFLFVQRVMHIFLLLIYKILKEVFQRNNLLLCVVRINVPLTKNFQKCGNLSE